MDPVPGYTATNRTALAVAPSDPSVVYALSRGISPSDRKEEADRGNPPPVTTKVARLQNGKFEPVFHMPTNLAGTGRVQPGIDGTRSSRWTRWPRT